MGPQVPTWELPALSLKDIGAFLLEYSAKDYSTRPRGCNPNVLRDDNYLVDATAIILLPADQTNGSWHYCPPFLNTYFPNQDSSQAEKVAQDPNPKDL